MDVDIDIQSGVNILKLFDGVVRASMVENGKLVKHPVGYYFQGIAPDAITGLASVPYKETDDIGFMKIDMLTVKLLNNFNSKQEMIDLQDQEPDWDMLYDPEVVPKLFHLSKHLKTLEKIQPKNIDTLADVFMLIRPNKINLIDKYCIRPSSLKASLYLREDASDMRRSHAIPYAILIVLQLHLIKQGRL